MDDLECERALQCPFLEFNKKLHFAPLAEFGPPIRGGRMEGRVVMTDPPFAETKLNNKEDLKGHIALIERGKNDFATKIVRAQEAGAIAVIIGNNDEKDPECAFVMSSRSEKVRSIRIPSIMLPFSHTKELQHTMEGSPITTVAIISLDMAEAAIIMDKQNNIEKEKEKEKERQRQERERDQQKQAAARLLRSLVGKPQSNSQSLSSPSLSSSPASPSVFPLSSSSLIKSSRRPTSSSSQSLGWQKSDMHYFGDSQNKILDAHPAESSSGFAFMRETEQRSFPTNSGGGSPASSFSSTPSLKSSSNLSSSPSASYSSASASPSLPCTKQVDAIQPQCKGKTQECDEGTTTRLHDVHKSAGMNNSTDTLHSPSIRHNASHSPAPPYHGTPDNSNQTNFRPSRDTADQNAGRVTQIGDTQHGKRLASCSRAAADAGGGIDDAAAELSQRHSEKLSLSTCMIFDEMQDIPFLGMEPVDPSSTVLLIVDAQYYCYKAMRPDLHPSYVAQYINTLQNEVLPHMQKLVHFARGNNIEIIYSKIENATADGRERSVEHRNLGVSVEKDSEYARIIDDVGPMDDEIVLSRTSSCVFRSTNLDYLLRNLRCKFLLVCGIDIAQSIQSTSKSAADLGYVTILLPEAIAFSSSRSAQRLRETTQYSCRFSKLDEIVAEASGPYTYKPTVLPRDGGSVSALEQEESQFNRLYATDAGAFSSNPVRQTERWETHIPQVNHTHRPPRAVSRSDSNTLGSSMQLLPNVRTVTS